MTNAKGLLAITVVTLLTTACTPRVIEPATPSVPQAPQLQIPAGFTSSVFAFGLNAPTALTFGPDPDPIIKQSRRLYVAQLNGGENAGTGQVIAIDSAGAKPQVILDKLMKPTGIAWFNDALYVVANRDVLKFSVTNGKLGEPQVLAKDVPFNGRSLGHIKVGPSPDPFTSESEPRLYFSSSGGTTSASGFIYSMKLDGNDQRIIARGLKNGYAFTWSLTDNTMYSTEIGDALVNPPPEEINIIQRDANYGWPACPATQTCAGVENPIATFPAHSTPTGIAWWENNLIVALFGPADPHVARITLDAQGKAGTSDFIRGMTSPIDVIVTHQGTLLTLDFEGMIWEIKKS